MISEGALLPTSGNKPIPRLALFPIALVWMAEAFNTCIEMLCDLWCKGEYHPQIKRIKDISAAAVLFISIAAAVTGAIIFLL